MDNPFELPPIPEKKSRPHREELVPPSVEETIRAESAVISGVLEGIYTREDYIDGAEARVRVKDKNGKIILDTEREEFDESLDGWYDLGEDDLLLDDEHLNNLLNNEKSNA